ncbi:MAG: sigma-54-dependent Fis family transcriptional regulator [Bacteroidales bacterium]|nr:sigma-54-dependent Fis family transcriptional regulator [Bacteroidales bacterium]MBP5389185.1 sigma-54-dependent Fis family transcriptional regulator [Bacteroidales bacterium]
MDAQELQRIKNKFDIIGNDAALNRAIETAVAVAQTDLAVLISGESGVGKENIPRIIHSSSRRRNAKYLSVNCGAIPEGTINAELFGHEKGAFTGAVAERKGYFEEADGGTLFLDEIGELPESTQAMLLRVLQDGEYIKVGSSKVEKTDVRVIAATNVDLVHAVGRGKFREDLYYRLNAVQIKMPALRERKDDIYLLFRKFTSDFAQKYGMAKVTLTHDAILALQNYRWPGNVRQLKNITESVTALESQRLSAFSDKCEVDAATLSRYIPKDDPMFLPAPVEGARSDLGGSDRQMIIKALFDLKAEIDELKKVVYAERPALTQTPVPAPAAVSPSLDADRGQEAEWQDSEPAPVAAPGADDLSLQHAEEDNILKALEKHHGNRKLAAAELGISERTLYRRLSRNEKH